MGETIERWRPILLGALFAALFGMFLRSLPAWEVAGDANWTRTLQVDGGAYVRGALRMIKNGRWILTGDVFHSIGMQQLTALLFRVTRSFASPSPVIYFNFIVWLALVVFFALAAWRATGNRIFAFGATTLLVLSTSLRMYRFLVQYEILAAFLLFVVSACAFPRTKGRAWALGALVAALCIIRVHFGLVLPFLIALNRRLALRIAAGFLLVAIPFNLYFSLTLERPFFFQANLSTKLLNENHLHANGKLFPYQKQAATRGIEYFKGHPAHYARLVAMRFGYLTGLAPDLWYVPAGWVTLWPGNEETGRVIFYSLAIPFFLLGVYWAWGRREIAFLFPILAVVIPIFIVNASARLLVPVLPCLIWFEALGLRALLIGVRSESRLP